MFDALYPWIKAFHVISVISWMAALLYLPRLFVYHAALSASQKDMSEQFKIMERKLARLIMTPAMIATWILGVLMIVYFGFPGLLSEGWFHVKLALVILMSGFHGWLIKRLKEFARDENSRSSRSYRVANEIPTVIMIVVVIMVIVRPF